MVDKDFQELRRELLGEIRALRQELRGPERRMLTVEQAAHYLGIAARTLRNRLGPRAAKPFEVRPVRVSGRVLFRKKDLDEYLDSLGQE